MKVKCIKNSIGDTAADRITIGRIYEANTPEIQDDFKRRYTNLKHECDEWSKFIQIRRNDGLTTSILKEYFEIVEDQIPQRLCTWKSGAKNWQNDIPDVVAKYGDNPYCWPSVFTKNAHTCGGCGHDLSITFAKPKAEPINTNPSKPFDPYTEHRLRMQAKQIEANHSAIQYTIEPDNSVDIDDTDLLCSDTDEVPYGWRR